VSARPPARLWDVGAGVLLGLLLAWLVGGSGLYRTHTARIGRVEVLYRVNRITGAVSLCVGAEGCRSVPEVPAHR
jgi:hypothetical protein